MKTLLWIKDWDFSWQERYRFEDFVDAAEGHAARRRRSATTTRRRTSATRAVRRCACTWGEESNDEMGSVGLQVVAATRGELPQLQRAFNAHLRTAATTRPGLKQLLQRRAGDRPR